MALEIIGKLIRKMPKQSGVSARGNWEKQEFVLETLDNFPRKICMNVWGTDKVADLENFNEGETLKASINIESREFNNRWYTDIRAWRLEKNTDAPAAGNDNGYASAQKAVSEIGIPPVNLDDTGEDDLPF